MEIRGGRGWGRPLADRDLEPDLALGAPGGAAEFEGFDAVGIIGG